MGIHINQEPFRAGEHQEPVKAKWFREPCERVDCSSSAPLVRAPAGEEQLISEQRDTEPTTAVLIQLVQRMEQRLEVQNWLIQTL